MKSVRLLVLFASAALALCAAVEVGATDAQQPTAVGDPCTTNANCTDNLVCNGATCVECLRNSDCSDDVFCNGIEQCVNNVCMGGKAPCTARQLCDESANVCRNTRGALVLCPRNQKEFLAQLNHPYGCRFIAGGGSTFTPVEPGLDGDGVNSYGAPIRWWTGKRLVRVGAANGNGWYRCVGGARPNCRLSYQYYQGLGESGRNFVRVRPMGAGGAAEPATTPEGAKIFAGPLEEDPAVLNTGDLHNICIKVQIQSAFVPSLGKTLNGPPQDDDNNQARKGWCAYLRVT
eukprot:jgi/Mesvir1/2899/Mv13972-RA.1